MNLSKLYKEFLKLSNKKINNSFEKWIKDLNRHLTKENIQIIDEHMKCYST